MSVLAFDVGLKTIGVAVSDKTRTLASPKLPIKVVDVPPLKTLSGTQVNDAIVNDAIIKLVALLEKAIIEYQPQDVLLGYPLNLDGTTSANARLIEQLCTALQKKLPHLAIHLQDERLSSWTVKRKYAHLKLKKNQASIKNIDSFAAVEILNDYLSTI